MTTSTHAARTLNQSHNLGYAAAVEELQEWARAEGSNDE